MHQIQILSIIGKCKTCDGRTHILKLVQRHLRCSQVLPGSNLPEKEKKLLSNQGL